MKAKQILFALLIASAAAPAYSQEEISIGNQILDAALYRPLGLLATFLGAGAFAITSPTTAIATLLPPHDAISSAAEAMVLAPAKFTFTRPLGEPLFKSHDARTGR